MPTVKGEHVAILLCTFNGEQYLPRQLDTILAQDHQDWSIHVSDDGSTDRTLAILRDYQQKLGSGRLTILDGPRKGYAANFMSLIHRVFQGDYYAFCDQDDCWDADKLSRALAWARSQPEHLPILYCGRTRLVNNDEQTIGHSPLFRLRPSFRNALVQSLAGGNTMLLNARARALMAQTPAEFRVISHDWWAYLLVTACAGRTHYDARPAISYRQHGENLIGSNGSLRDRFARLKHMLIGNYREWNDANLEGLKDFEPFIAPDNRRVLSLFMKMRSAGILRRLYSLARGGFYRQTLPGNLGMVLAVVLRRF